MRRTGTLSPQPATATLGCRGGSKTNVMVSPLLVVRGPSALVTVRTGDCRHGMIPLAKHPKPGKRDKSQCIDPERVVTAKARRQQQRHTGQPDQDPADRTGRPMQPTDEGR